MSLGDRPPLPPASQTVKATHRKRTPRKRDAASCPPGPSPHSRHAEASTLLGRWCRRSPGRLRQSSRRSRNASKRNSRGSRRHTASSRSWRFCRRLGSWKSSNGSRSSNASNSTSRHRLRGTVRSRWHGRLPNARGRTRGRRRYPRRGSGSSSVSRLSGSRSSSSSRARIGRSAARKGRMRRRGGPRSRGQIETRLLATAATFSRRCLLRLRSGRKSLKLTGFARGCKSFTKSRPRTKRRGEALSPPLPKSLLRCRSRAICIGRTRPSGACRTASADQQKQPEGGARKRGIRTRGNSGARRSSACSRNSWGETTPRASSGEPAQDRRTTVSQRLRKRRARACSRTARQASITT
mmetsp:Transcript_60728/g.144507  ORF Transcript_60728/g.144507 Transcript_60728/m.144507 type:complete len:353 (+) Transcript_60728:884-1942(+)